MSKYSDIGKATNDLINKDFPVNVIKVEAKGVEKTGQNFLSKFNFMGTRDATSGAVQGEVKNTLTCLLSRPFAISAELEKAPMVLECTSTLASDGSVTEQLELKDPLIRGLNVAATGHLLANGPLNVKLNLDYSQTLMSSVLLTKNACIDVSKGSRVTTEAALRYNGFVLGAQTQLAPMAMMHQGVSKESAGLLDNYSLALGYDILHYKATLHALNKGSVLAAAFYQRFTSGVETGFKASWNRKTATPQLYGLELVAKFPLDHGAWMKCKFDNAGKLGLAYSTALNAKVALTLAAAFDTLKMDSANHRLGMGFVVDL